MPQNLCLLITQSRRFLTMFINRDLAHEGCHSIRSASRSSSSLSAVTLIIHCLVALRRRGVLHLQHTGYLCTTLDLCSRAPLSSRSLIIASLASVLKYRPAYFPASLVMRPSSPTRDIAGTPSFEPISKSTSPWPGAECTSPVPSYALTASGAITTW